MSSFTSGQPAVESPGPCVQSDSLLTSPETLAVTATVTGDRSVPWLPLPSRCSSQVPPYGSQGLCAPASARSPPCVQFGNQSSFSSWNVGVVPILRTVPGLFFLPQTFPHMIFLSSTHSSRSSLNVIMQRAFHKPLTLVF